MRDAPRLGLVAAPLPLVAAYVQPLTGVGVFLILIEAEAILKNGIALTDVKTFVGSDSGGEARPDACRQDSLRAAGGQLLRPVGMVLHPALLQPRPLQ